MKTVFGELNAASRKKIKVLIVDDSAIVRKLLSESLAAEHDIEVVGTAPDPYIARDKILSLSPDVLTLDIEMPRMDGITFLKKLMSFRPMPVILISSIASAACENGMEALRAGAVEILSKPGGPYSVGEFRASLANKIRSAAVAKLKTPAAKPAVPAVKPAVLGKQYDPRIVIAIGASTGGTEAIEELLTHLPANSPGIVIAQHIPAGFSRAFANRLDKICAMRVSEASDGDMVEPGVALIAPGNFHMLIRELNGKYRVNIQTGPLVCYQRPSVDVLFNSVAQTVGPHTVGVILTGMGSDGAEGMKKLRAAGAHTIAQDEDTCVVFGMPKAAIRLGCVETVLPLQFIAPAILSAAGKYNSNER